MNGKARVLLVSALRDEGPHVCEWVAHHRALGVTDFLLFTNDCSDGTDQILEAMLPLNVVHMNNVRTDGKSVQWSALKAAWAHPLRKQTDWIMCLDCDEFLNLREPLNSVQDLIGDFDAITLPWRLFGHNGHAHAPNLPTTEAFTRCAPENCPYPVGARQFKTLFRNPGPFRQIGVHRPRLKKGATARWVDGSGNAMPNEFAKAEQRILLYGFPDATAKVQLNHYSLRSAESFMLKRARGLPNRRTKEIDLTYWVEKNFNTVEDHSIARHRDATNAALAEIMDLPNVADLHRAAVKHHKLKFAELMRDPEMVKFFGRLLLADGSASLSQSQAQELVQMYQATQRAGA